MNTKDFIDEQGKCPKCKGLNLDYQPADFTDSMVYFRWTCEDCGQEGEEWYDMSFAGHNIITEDGEEIEL